MLTRLPYIGSQLLLEFVMQTKRRTTNYLNKDQLLHEILLSKDTQKNCPQKTPAECLTKTLVEAFCKLVDRYARRGNFRNYCVDDSTVALTKRGWLSFNQILVGKDEILCLDPKTHILKWSVVKDLYIGDYDGLMFKLDGATVDALVTPRHKFLTEHGLKRIEDIRAKEHLITMGESMDQNEETYSDAFVELVGWFVTEGSIDTYKKKRTNETSYYGRVSQSTTVNSKKCTRIQDCINALESLKTNYVRNKQDQK